MISICCYRENGKWKSNDCYCSYICCPLSIRPPRLLYPYLHFYYTCVGSLFIIFSAFYSSCPPFPHQNCFRLCSQSPRFCSLPRLPFSLISSFLSFYLFVYFLFFHCVEKMHGPVVLSVFRFWEVHLSPLTTRLWSIWGFPDELLSCSSSK